MSIGDNIKKYRKATKLSQQDLANQTGLSIGTIQGYEQGRYFPKYENLRKLATTFSCKVSDLNPNYADVLFKDFVDSVTTAVTVSDNQILLEDYITKRKLLIKYFDQLNKNGQEVALKQIEELIKVTKYKR